MENDLNHIYYKPNLYNIFMFKVNHSSRYLVIKLLYTSIIYESTSPNRKTTNPKNPEWFI
jgi:hypothetical protein